MMDTIYFLAVIFILLSSCVGHGIFISKIFKFNYHSSIGFNGLLGLIFLTLISYLSVLILEDKTFFNVLVFLIGFIIFLTKIKKIKISTLEIIIILSLITSIFISKTHDDFPFYHLQQSLNFSLNKFYIGLPNLNFFYSYHSSILFLNSIFYLPYFKFYLFYIPILFFLIFSVLLLYENIINFKNLPFLRFYALFCLLFILTKFTRLSEHGTDISGQIIILISILYFFKFFYDKKNNTDYLLFFFLIITLSLTIKTYFVFYSILILVVFLSKNISFSFNLLRQRFYYFVFLFIFVSLFFSYNILSTGCLIFPIKQSCFTNLSWSMLLVDVEHYSNWFEKWSKSLAGAGYVVDNSSNLLLDFDWVKIWFKNYSHKYLETLYLLIFISLLLVINFRPFNKKTEIKKEVKIILIFFMFILVFWFLKHPTLRYGGYVIHISIFSILTSILLVKSKLSNVKTIKYSKVLIFLALAFFTTKNIIRINNEILRSDQYKYSNFPYYFVQETDYEKIKLSDDVSIYYVPTACWATPPPCAGNKNIILTELYGFKVLKNDK